MAAANELSVLVVEDEPTTRLIVEKFLRTAGHDVASAKNGQIALRKIEKTPGKFDIVLSDVNMPKMGGMELLTRIREHENDAIARTVVVMMSSAKDATTSYKALQAGADDFILKPVRKGAFDKFGELARVGHVGAGVAGGGAAPSVAAEEAIRSEQQAIVDATQPSKLATLTERAQRVVDLAAETDADEGLRQEVSALVSELSSAMQLLLLSSSASSTSSFVGLVASGSLPDEAKAYLSGLVGASADGRSALEARLGGAVVGAASDDEDEGGEAGGGARALCEISTFDVWSSDDEMLSTYVIDMFRALGLLRAFLIPVEVLEAFVAGVSAGIPIANPFHSFRRAVDVAQLAFWLLTRGEAQKYLDAADVLGIMLAALTFQLGHTGTSNAFHAATRSEVDMVYNSVSPVENRAASLASALLAEPATNVLANVAAPKAAYVRSLMIDCILATDLARHPQLLASFNLVVPQFSGDSPSHRALLAQMVVKAADFSLDIRPFTLAKYWSDMKTEEELREAAALSTAPALADPCLARVALMDYISIPLFTALSTLLPAVGATCTQALETNRFTWEALVDTKMFARSE